VTYTHTYAVLSVSPGAYEEIRSALQAAGYSGQFHDGLIDMHGLALRPKPSGASGECEVCSAEKCRCDECGAEWCLDHTPNPLTCPSCGDRPFGNRQSCSP